MNFESCRSLNLWCPVFRFCSKNQTLRQNPRDGRTNRQIAQEFYVSIKTVEGHLARAYGKLGIDSREELDRVLDPEKARVSTL